MLGTPENPGLLPCTLKDVFNMVEKSNMNVRVHTSYCEIYNESINDLLNQQNTNLKILEDPNYGCVVQGLTKELTSNFEEAISILHYGEENRAYREKNFHEHSSRSHTIFVLYFEVENEN